MTEERSKRPTNPIGMIAECLGDIDRALQDPTPYQPGACPFVDNAGVVYSNFDHEFDEDVRKQAEKGNCSVSHTAWDFHGTVWFDGKRWNEEIRRYRTLVETMTADSLEELIEQSNEKYGSA